MGQEYTIFKKFPTLEQAKEVEEILNENDIATRLGDNIAPVDVTFSGNTLLNEVEVQIKQENFKKAEEILQKNAELLIEQVDKDYYLFDFDDNELYDILVRSDEWNEFDYMLAQKILVQRGKPIDKELLESLNEHRIEELKKPEKGQAIWIFVGYLCAILGGLLGIAIGYMLWKSKKTLPNGEKVYSYTQSHRIHGQYIFYIGLVLPIFLIFNLLIDW